MRRVDRKLALIIWGIVITLVIAAAASIVLGRLAVNFILGGG